MAREIMWAPVEGPGLELLRLALDPAGAVVDGLVLGVEEGRPFRVRYEVRCDAGWRVREVRVETLDDEANAVTLLADGEGRWTDERGEALPELDGCLVVDLSATPFTNTLPIRRLGLRPGESAELRVAYVAVPGLEVEAVPQRYACLTLGADGGRYRYESLPYPALPQGFVAELAVDGDGLVVDYPGLFRRVWPESPTTGAERRRR